MFDDDMLYYDVDSACTSVNIQVPSVGGMDRDCGLICFRLGMLGANGVGMTRESYPIFLPDDPRPVGNANFYLVTN